MKTIERVFATDCRKRHHKTHAKVERTKCHKKIFCVNNFQLGFSELNSFLLCCENIALQGFTCPKFLFSDERNDE